MPTPGQGEGGWNIARQLRFGTRPGIAGITSCLASILPTDEPLPGLAENQSRQTLTIIAHAPCSYRGAMIAKSEVVGGRTARVRVESYDMRQGVGEISQGGTGFETGEVEPAPYGAEDLLDTPPEDAFDRVTKLVARLLRTPVALVTILDRDRQFFKGEVGLPEPWHSRRETPLTHSFCQHVVATEAPLVVEDARSHPLVCNNLAIEDLGVEAYLGHPIRRADGVVIGSLCAIDVLPRIWTGEESELLADLAGIIETELALRDEIRRREEAEAARILLMREMEHRVKNSFAKVQAIVSLTLRGQGDAGTMRDAVIERIAALARTQSLLADAGSNGTTVGEILANELGHYDEGGKGTRTRRLKFDGETVRLSDEEAVAIGMVVHELGTNAAKYGAIAKGGFLHVAWRETAAETGRRLRLEWRETGISIAGRPVTRGFGSKLLETLVVRQHNGSITRDWPGTGLVLVAELDLAERAAADAGSAEVQPAVPLAIGA